MEAGGFLLVEQVLGVVVVVKDGITEVALQEKVHHATASKFTGQVQRRLEAGIGQRHICPREKGERGLREKESNIWEKVITIVSVLRY